MSHCDPMSLALLALGEDIPAEERAHLETCEQCLTEAGELVEVVTLGREAPAHLDEVPGSVWAGIVAELGLENAPDGDDSLPSAPVVPLPVRPPSVDEPLPAASAPATVVSLERRRGRLWTVGAAAAAVGALVGGSVVWAAVNRGSTGSTPTEVVTAQAVLDPLKPSVPSPGEATVLDSPDGTVIRVDARSLPAYSGFYEVWLLDAQATKLIALGALPSGSVGTFTLPPGVSLADYPVVDISLEPVDGNPAHSKDSLMRGTLEA